LIKTDMLALFVELSFEFCEFEVEVRDKLLRLSVLSD